jgi:hypothetical protein
VSVALANAGIWVGWPETDVLAPPIPCVTGVGDASSVSVDKPQAIVDISRIRRKKYAARGLIVFINGVLAFYSQL